MHLIKSSNKLQKDKANKEDIAWAENKLEKIFNTGNPTKNTPVSAKYTPTKPTDDIDVEDDLL